MTDIDRGGSTSDDRCLSVSVVRACGHQMAYLPGLAMRRIADLYPGQHRRPRLRHWHWHWHWHWRQGKHPSPHRQPQTETSVSSSLHSPPCPTQSATPTSPRRDQRSSRPTTPGSRITQIERIPHRQRQERHRQELRVLLRLRHPVATIQGPTPATTSMTRCRSRPRAACSWRPCNPAT
jgi:hypothetical protein